MYAGCLGVIKHYRKKIKDDFEYTIRTPSPPPTTDP